MKHAMTAGDDSQTTPVQIKHFRIVLFLTTTGRICTDVVRLDHQQP